VISNEGDQPARLLRRHWLIIDADGHREEVRGPGVVGETPRLEPGKAFKYQSFCPLKTRWGTMEGSYTMQRDDGSTFEASIARFYLRLPSREPAATS
jgi:ApaG protein